MFSRRARRRQSDCNQCSTYFDFGFQIKSSNPSWLAFLIPCLPEDQKCSSKVHVFIPLLFQVAEHSESCTVVIPAVFTACRSTDTMSSMIPVVGKSRHASVHVWPTVLLHSSYGLTFHKMFSYMYIKPPNYFIQNIPVHNIVTKNSSWGAYVCI